MQKSSYTKEDLVNELQRFYKEFGKIPSSKDFNPKTKGYPGIKIFQRLFGDWPSALKAAGFQTYEEIRNSTHKTVECGHCGTEIQTTEKEDKKFCNSSCAASFHNALRDKSVTEKAQDTLNKTLLEKGLITHSSPGEKKEFTNYFYATKFELHQVKHLPVLGKELFEEFGLYHPKNNPTGVFLNNIFSIQDGFRQGIPRATIHHLANCQFITADQRNEKGGLSWISLDELEILIDDWNLKYPKSSGKSQSKETKIVDPSLVPQNGYKKNLIEITQVILGITTDVTWNDVELLKERINFMMYEENMSPADIKKKYDIKYSEFAMFINGTLGLKLRTVKESINNYNIQSGKAVTDEKEIYRSQCKFAFNPYSFPEMEGYDLLLEKGIFHAINNPEGMTRDHLMSIEYGWQNDIEPELISHPANCRFIGNIDNIKKGSSSLLTRDQLVCRIQLWLDNAPLTKDYTYLRVPKTEETKKKQSDANKGKMYYTNGKKNICLKPGEKIPDGFWRGSTRKNKMK